MLRSDDESRLEAVTGILGAIFVPLGLLCLNLHDAHPHRAVYVTLESIAVLIGAPSIWLSMALRWRRWRRAKRSRE